MKKTLLIMILIFSSFMATAAGWTGYLQVEDIYVYGNHDRILVVTDNSTQYTPGCSLKTWELAGSNAEAKQRLYSAVLAANMSGRKIRFWYDDECGISNYHRTSVMRLPVID